MTYGYLWSLIRHGKGGILPGMSGVAAPGHPLTYVSCRGGNTCWHSVPYPSLILPMLPELLKETGSLKDLSEEVQERHAFVLSMRDLNKKGNRLEVDTSLAAIAS